MSELNVNINKYTYETLVNMADSSGETINEVLEKAIENYRRTVFLEKANRAFEKLKTNEQLWSEEIAERLTWDLTLADGVED